MKLRIISSIVGLPILIAIILSNNPIIINISLLLIITLGLIEFYRSFEDFSKSFGLIGLGFSFLYFIFVSSNLGSYLGLFLFLFSTVLILYSVIFYSKQNAKNIAITFIGFFYVTFMFSFIRLIINIRPYGSILVWFVFVIAWSADTFALTVGKSIGKKKLTPELSPNKSVEGFVGGIVGATVCSYIYGFIIMHFISIDIKNFLFICIVLGAIGSIISQCGDLIASLVKRFNNVKDFGKVIPGHGGILDRFDSVILLSPFVYYFFITIMK